MEADPTVAADRVVVSYRANDTDLSDDDGLAENHLVHDRIQDRPFRAYLRRVHGGEVAVGDEWSEFINTGCGTTTDVVLRVERVAGGTVLDESTEIGLVPASER